MVCPSGERTLAQAALVSQPASTARADVVAHALKNRRVYASTRWAFDEEAVAALTAASYDRAFYPEGATRQYAAILASPPRTVSRARPPTGSVSLSRTWPNGSPVTNGTRQACATCAIGR